MGGAGTRFGLRAHNRRVGMHEMHVMDHSHRDIRSGGLRAAIFGISDGLVTNISLVLGLAAAQPGFGVVRLAGLAGLLGGSFSMAAGEFISMSAQREAFQRELAIERREIIERPEGERNELRVIYERRGIAPSVAKELVNSLMENPDVALETHAREELGIDPNALGSPIRASLASCGSFALGAFIPLIAFLNGTSHHSQMVISIVVTAIAASAVGGVLAVYTGRSRVLSALRSLGLCAAAGAITFGIGSAIGLASH